MPGAKFSISPGREGRSPRGCTVVLAARKVTTTDSASPAHCCPWGGSGAVCRFGTSSGRKTSLPIRALSSYQERDK